MNNCLHKCYMMHDKGIYRGREYRNSEKKKLVMQLT